MATTPGSNPGTAPYTTPGDGMSTQGGGSVAERAGREYLSSRETKPGFLTSEFVSSIVAALGILIAAAMEDNFEADEAWRLIAFLSIGYMISRGIAKSGVGRGRGDR